MNGFYVSRIFEGHTADYPRTPIAALHNVIVVFELEHEFVHRFGLVVVLEAWLVGVGGPAIAE